MARIKTMHSDRTEEKSEQDIHYPIYTFVHRNFFDDRRPFDDAFLYRFCLRFGLLRGGIIKNKKVITK